jgi:hypothetical protein
MPLSAGGDAGYLRKLAIDAAGAVIDSLLRCRSTLAKLQRCCASAKALPRLWGKAFAALGLLGALIVLVGGPKHHRPGPRVFHVVREFTHRACANKQPCSKMATTLRHRPVPKGSTSQNAASAALFLLTRDEARRIAADMVSGQRRPPHAVARCRRVP